MNNFYPLSHYIAQIATWHERALKVQDATIEQQLSKLKEEFQEWQQAIVENRMVDAYSHAGNVLFVVLNVGQQLDFGEPDEDLFLKNCSMEFVDVKPFVLSAKGNLHAISTYPQFPAIISSSFFGLFINICMWLLSNGERPPYHLQRAIDKNMAQLHAAPSTQSP